MFPASASDLRRMLLELLIAGGIAACTWFVFPQQVRTVLSQAYQHVSPCSAPVTYRIGAIDPRFGLSPSDVQTLLANAAAKWNIAAGKTVLAYDPTHGVVVVNFTYDNRQEDTTKLGAIGTSIQGGTAQYDSLKAQYASQESRYRADKAAFDAAYASYTQQQAQYDQAVAQWNARGGAPSGTYAQLQSQQQSLQAQAAQLQKQEASINSEVDALNALAGEINQLISSLNLNVSRYNAVGASLGGDFEAGEFVSSIGKEYINIFEYDSALRLHRVLEHEFGHAIGLEHVSDPQAIMNALNQGSSENLTVADIDELDSVCH